MRGKRRAKEGKMEREKTTNHYKVCIFVSASNDEMVEGDPGNDSDFEINARKEVSQWCNR